MGDVLTIDTGYGGRERHTAAYLLPEGDRAAFIETNTNHAVPRLLEALRATGRTPEQVEHVIITHVHLDHAGGAAALMRACPNATLLAHPKAAKHAIDPSKLVKSARAVYGDDVFERLYGTIEPIPEERVRILEDNETVDFGERRFRFLHTRGHANHHFCVLDEAHKHIFTGDAFGLVYPYLQRDGLFAIPSTSPTDFDGPAAKASLDRIVETGAERAYPTHFDAVTELGAIREQLHRWLDFSSALVEEAYASDTPDEELDAQFLARVEEEFTSRLAGTSFADDDVAWDLLRDDIDLNAQGLAFAVKKRRFKDQQAEG
ncbi:MAG: MBL fold metallo-hydrolase [Sandaracinaceae bacterium]